MFCSRAFVRDAVGGKAADVQSFLNAEFVGPLGMRHAIMQSDATGTPLGAHEMLASARDWARFGELSLEDGVVGGRRILPEGWASYSASPTPGGWVGGGAGFWTNQGTSKGAQYRTARGMPADAYQAQGQFGQYVVVIPSRRLVIVRLGKSPSGGEIDALTKLVGP